MKETLYDERQGHNSHLAYFQESTGHTGGAVFDAARRNHPGLYSRYVDKTRNALVQLDVVKQ